MWVTLKKGSRTEQVSISFLSFAPLFILIYSFMVYLGIFAHVPKVAADSFTPFALSASLIVLGFFAKKVVTKSRRAITFYLIIYNLLLLAYLFLVSDLTSLPTLLWAALLVTTFLYLGRTASLVSITVFFLLGVIGSLFYDDPLQALLVNLIYAICLSLLSTLIAIMLTDIEDDRKTIESSRMQLAIQKERTATLINNLTDTVISTNIDGKIVIYNAALLNLIDSNADLEDQMIGDVIHLQDDTGEPVDINNLLLNSGRAKTRNDLSMIVDGEQIKLEMTSQAIHSAFTGDTEAANRDSGYIVILRDITRAKSLEDEKDEFISVVSHELRTPITVAEGTLSNTDLMMRRKDVAKQKILDSVNLAHDQIVFLAKMVNDLSTLSRAERGIASEAEDIDVQEMVHNLYNEYLPEATAKKLHFDLNMPGKIGHVLTSRLYLKELLQNFVTNAIKYTKEGSVTITVKQTAGVISFTVKDTGIGISKVDQKKIYNRFFRAEDYRTRETSGTGLGLYVAQKLAAKIGTTIELVSRLNHGSSFSITLAEYKPK